MMKIKQVEHITSDYAVLATRKDDFREACFDKQDDGHTFSWAVVDGGSGARDGIELIDVDADGNQRICERCLVVARKECPFCNHKMEPYYDNEHTPVLWQECPSCGYELDMRREEE